MERKWIFIVVLVGISQSVFSQRELTQRELKDDTIYNTNSATYKTAERIPYYEQMYRYRVTRFVDLREKQNAVFNSSRSKLTSVIIELVAARKLKPYSNETGYPADFNIELSDSTTVLTKADWVRDNTKGYWNATTTYQATEQVMVRLTDPKTKVADDYMYQANQSNTGVDPRNPGIIWTSEPSPLHKPISQDITSIPGISIIEDVIFDKRRSRLVYDVVAVGLATLDAASNKVVTGWYVKYADLVDLLEKMRMSKDPAERMKVMWSNPYNPAENKTYVDAFKLRLFHGVIEKVENPDNLSITEIYTASGSRYWETVWARWEEDMKMMEKEHNLWEF